MKHLLLPYFLVLFITTRAFSQQSEAAAVPAIQNLLRQELGKATIPGNTLRFTTEPESSGICFSLSRNENLLSQYGLLKKPEDAFYIKATAQSLYILSRSADGLRNGAYWYLQQLGFRYYFPDNTWHFTPVLKTPYVPVVQTVSPSFSFRRIWYAYGTGSKKADADYDEWYDANLLGGDDVSVGHAYDGIVARNKAEFLAHPEYFAQKVAKGNIPRDPKFEVSNEALVQLCIQDAFQQIEKTSTKKGASPAMISMDPSDGGGFSTSPESLKIGGPSEQAFYLADRVARALREKYPAIKVGMYAYNFHAAPPKFAVEPNIIVFVATALNRSPYRTDDLIKLWDAKGVTVGLRDYYGVMAWDWDMPGQPKGARLGYVSQLKNYYDKGIRLFTAETNIGWISRGVGHYIAAQLLWNKDADVQELKRDFFNHMFGNAATPMTKLYDEWETYNQPVPLETDLQDWYAMVQRAATSEPNPAVQARINQVKAYLQYVYLFQQWRKNNSDANEVALFNYAYRVKDDGIVASYPLFRRLANSAVDGKENMRFDDPNALWKRNSSPVTADEIARNFQAVFKPGASQPQAVSMAFPKSFAVKKEVGSTPSPTVKLRGIHTIVFQTGSSNASIQLTAGDKGKALRVVIYNYTPELTTAQQTPVLQQTTPSNGTLQSVSLAALKPGTYIAQIDGGKNGFALSFSGSIVYGIVAQKTKPAWTVGRNTLVFSVSKQTTISIIAEGVFTLRSPSGHVYNSQQRKGLPEVLSIPNAEPGLWKFEKQVGVISLQGVLPLLSADEAHLLTLMEQ